MSIKEICVCGHDKCTHHEKKHACLGMRCECDVYRDERAATKHPVESRERSLRNK